MVLRADLTLLQRRKDKIREELHRLELLTWHDTTEADALKEELVATEQAITTWQRAAMVEESERSDRTREIKARRAEAVEQARKVVAQRAAAWEWFQSVRRFSGGPLPAESTLVQAEEAGIDQGALLATVARIQSKRAPIDGGYLESPGGFMMRDYAPLAP